MTTRVTASEKLRIVALGYIVRGPLGGLVWHHLQYVLGLAKLGHDVYFLEDSDDYPACYDPQSDNVGTDASFGLHFIKTTFDRFELGDSWSYFDAHTNRWFGLSESRVREICASADILLNLSAVNPLRPWLAEIPRRVFVDTDPAFTQIRHLHDAPARDLAAAHTSFFTFAENIALPDCLVPDDGFPWQPTRQPIVLDAWPITPGHRKAPWTTVMQWESYTGGEHQGMRFGMKSESFKPYLDLPHTSGQAFAIAVGSPATPREALSGKGWEVRNPLEVIRDPVDYQDFIQKSKGEWTVAKHGYVVSRSGWFSERSAAYLASGRPVVTEETGFSQWLPVGEGLHSFNSQAGAINAMETVDSDYEFQCRSARTIAEEYFDSGRVLSSLLERVLEET